jgi:hypothetical protein
MKEQLKILSFLIQKINDIENKDEYDLLMHQIKEELFNFFLDASKDSFITVVNLKVLKPIQDNTNVASQFIETKRSRSFRSTRLKMLSKRDFLVNLRNQILIDYKEQLKETETYKKFLIEKANDRFLILNPILDYPIEVFPLKSFEEILKKSYNASISYFEKQSLLNENYKNELFLFVNKIREELKRLANKLILLGKEKKECSNGDSDYFYCLYNEIQLLSLQSSYLNRLINKFESSHLFLKIFVTKKEIPLTVFGDRDMTKLEKLFFELEYFLDKSVKSEDILNVFTLDFQLIQKIDLKNGTTNDFAYLISEMNTYFIKEISDRKEYNQWWADRFTFNGVEKVKKAISTMRSNTKKGGIRQQVKTTRINAIVNVLR